MTQNAEDARKDAAAATGQKLEPFQAERAQAAAAMDEKLVNWFTHHPPTGDQVSQYVAIRAAGLAFARVIVANSPASADQSVAIRAVRDAVMNANCAIACEGR